MTKPNLPAPILVTEPAHLEEVVSELAEEVIIAADTESNSLHAYQEQVCLIQFSTSDNDYLIDPLALEDLSPLGQLFSDPGIEIVFHAAEYDLICLQRDFGFAFANLFDTMLAARILGWPKIGLGDILFKEYGVYINKKYQRADWGRRPLPGHLLRYASLDTHYLIPLRDKLRAELENSGRWPLAEEDFARLCQLPPPRENSKAALCWKINGARHLTPQQSAVLQELCLFRDRIARRLDQPLFKVLSDRTLFSIAATCPRNWQQLGRIPGLREVQRKRYGNGILAAVRRGLRGKPLHPPRAPGRDDGYLVRLEAIRNWRKNTALAMGVESGVVLPRDVLYEIARQNPSSRQELAQLMAQLPWRLQRFGEEIIRVLKEVERL